MSQQNDHLVLIGGKSGGGKSASLRNLPEPEGVLYLNCEAGKKLPFAAKFRKGPDGQTGFKITDPYQVYDAFDFAEKQGNSIHTIVVDSQTFLMDMFESVHVIPAADTQKAWGMYQQYYKNLMQQYVAGSSKNVIFTAHIIDVLNDSEHVMETKVPVKGALKNQGIEALENSAAA